MFLPISFYHLQIKVTLSASRDGLNLVEVFCNASDLIQGLKDARQYITKIEVFGYLCDSDLSLIEQIAAPIFEDLVDELLDVLKIEQMLHQTTVHYPKVWA